MMIAEEKKYKEILIENKKLIDEALKNYLKKLVGPAELKKAMEYACFPGGKRLRPVLTIECAKISGGSVKSAIPFACAVEMVHNFSLIHDDLPSMDDDDMRRGKPSCHKKFGEALAVLAGDALLNLAFKIIADSKQKKALDAIKLLSEAVGVTNMLGGQALDIEYERKQKSDNLLKRNINAMKTAALFAFSCKLGALAAPATKKESDILYQFGLDLGHAFQVADDLADMKCGKVMLNRMRKDLRMFVSKAKLKIAPFRKKSGILEYITEEILKKAEEE